MNVPPTTAPVEILLIEPHPGELRLAQEAIGGWKIRNNLHVARSGEEALDFLRSSRDGDHVSRPDLILLDLSLPRMSGLDLLHWIKNDPDFGGVPVIVLTTPDEPQTVIRCYEEHANCFIEKPLDLDRFLNVVLSIESFWCTIVKLPDRDG